MRLIIAIPTTGRREIVAGTVRAIARQTRLPDLVLVVVARDTDIDPAALDDLPFPARIEHSQLGLTRQRNLALEQVMPDDLLLFLDDDFLMADDYLAELEKLFLDQADIVMATGTVLLDGIHGPGISLDAATAALLGPAAGQRRLVPVYNGYGCNMAVRGGPVVQLELRFDVALPLYGWLEDVDFSRRLSVAGRVVRSDALRGVHLGTKTGRVNGLRLGYSQIANPLYLMRKGSMHAARALRIMASNLAKNLLRSPWPEAGIDRRGRLKGNFRAFADLLRGQLRPERAAELE
ncbi:MAG: glycosyltransferase [Paracoccaceae bacterium]